MKFRLFENRRPRKIGINIVKKSVQIFFQTPVFSVISAQILVFSVIEKFQTTKNWYKYSEKIGKDFFSDIGRPMKFRLLKIFRPRKIGINIVKNSVKIFFQTPVFSVISAQILVFFR